VCLRLILAHSGTGMHMSICESLALELPHYYSRFPAHTPACVSEIKFLELFPEKLDH